MEYVVSICSLSKRQLHLLHTDIPAPFDIIRSCYPHVMLSPLLTTSQIPRMDPNKYMGLRTLPRDIDR